MKNNLIKILLVLLLAVLMIGCADKVDVTSCIGINGEPAGFWEGVWHGLVMVPSFIGSLIWDDVAIYAVNNNGGWYDFGYVGGFFFLVKLFFGILKSIR